jgi:hypothetical protein
VPRPSSASRTRVAQELDGVPRKEERDLVPVFHGRPADEEAECGPGRMLGPVRDVDEDPGHAPIVAAEACGSLGETLATRIQLCGRVTIELDGTRLEHGLPGRQGRHRLLMEVLAARDNGAEALRVYDRLRVLLREELGADPSAATQQLHRRLLSA